MNTISEIKQDNPQIKQDGPHLNNNICQSCHKHCIKCEYGYHWTCDLCDIEGEYNCNDTEYIGRCNKCMFDYLSKK